MALVFENGELVADVGEPLGAAGGTTQVVWQLAAWELQVIMQLVVIELCAKRIGV
jgi:hypothetical protein